MPLTYFLYRCPHCGKDPLEGAGDEAWCPSCGTTYARGGEGGRIRVQTPQGPAQDRYGAHLAGGMDPGGEGAEGKSRRASVVARWARGPEAPVSHGGEVVGFAESLGEPREGILELGHHVLTLWGEEGGNLLDEWPLLDLAAIQTSSSTLQISPGPGGVVVFRFRDDSPRRWEELLHRRLRERVRETGRGEILEFQPRIVATGDRHPPPEAPGTRKRRLPTGPGPRWQFRESPLWRLSWYGLMRGVAGLLIRIGSRARVRGREHIPAAGPFILVSNHQSVLDPILVQWACPRPVHTLTKSTQFGQGWFRWLLPRLNAIPTRRYRIEPQAIRVMLRRLAEGRGVGIYPEGERSWDGALQPFRRGTIRFLLRAGVPVIPCGVSGAYDVWPRWSKRIRRKTVFVSFGAPLELPVLNSRWDAEEKVEETGGLLKAAFVQLGAWTKEGPGGRGA